MENLDQVTKVVIYLSILQMFNNKRSVSPRSRVSEIMNVKSIASKVMKEKKQPLFAHEFLSLIFDEIDLGAFFENSKNLASLVVQSGSTVTMTDSMLKRRQQLGLPEIACSDNVEVKKLAKVTGLSKILKEKT